MSWWSRARSTGGHTGRSICFAGVLLCVMARPGVAAAELRIAILNVDLEGDLPSSVRGDLVGALEAGLRPTASHVADPEEVAAELGELGLGDCIEPQCFERLSRGLGVAAFLRARIGQHGPLYTVDTELLLGRDGSSLGSVDQRCTACTWSEAVQTVTRAAFGLTASFPGVLTISVSPETAELTVDGHPAEAGAAIALRPGTHRVAAVAEGGAQTARDVEVLAGSVSEVSLAVAAGSGTPDPPRTRPDSRPGLWIGGWITASLAAGALVPGILWLALDGQCAMGSEMVGDLCADVYDTWRQGVGLTVVGGALLIASVALFSVHVTRAERGPAVAIRFSPSPQGASVGIAGLF